ncbi:ribonuclease Y [Apilactobacillus apisilvae]|uniref:Ribonuclease Y n=1 Tax=Apilactobacillus apisilvae TaxID=2923364 RepID=A0ABY4PGR5_9LACO|nr:ribonuclease Y [Apilactobacillus apisilvae]UQS84552.1 ribonuclease Y [Apilactobacillus apisilvae]
MISFLIILFLILGIILGVSFDVFRIKNLLKNAQMKANYYIESSDRDVNEKYHDIINDDKSEIDQYHDNADDEIDTQQYENETRKQRLDQHENFLNQTKQHLITTANELKERQTKQNEYSSKIDNVLDNAHDLLNKRQELLEKISKTNFAEAKQQVLDETNLKLKRESDIEVKYQLAENKVSANKKANSLLIEAIQRGARDEPKTHIERNVVLPSSDMKAKLIGKEEQHIRLIQSLTGTDLIFDDDNSLLLHIVTHDAFRREIVRMTIDNLMISRKFTNNNIEYQVNVATQRVHAGLRETGENVVKSLKIGLMHPDLMKIIGKLKFRTSYGQNVLYHSIEVAQITGVLAAELGLNVKLAKRSGLLHDIGKAIDHEVDGTHVELGVKLTKAFNEDDIVINSIASHHGDVDPIDPISILVATADSMSGARPGARSESIEEYVTRLRNLENIANQHAGVKDSYAIQAGREIRIIVNPEMLNDDKSKSLTRHVRDQIQDELTYPGNIKVTTIRSLKAVQYVGKRKKQFK